MRNELYGDRKDVSKWSIVSNLARECNIKMVYYVAMLNKPMGIHGNNRDNARIVDSKVKEFFDEERQLFDNNSSLRQVSRICRLTNYCNYPFEIKCYISPFPGDDRRIYFKTVMRDIHQHKLSKIVLLDPDNGIQGITQNGLSSAKARRTHVTADEISELLDVLQTGDFLVVYQDQFRDENWTTLALDSMRYIVQNRANVTSYCDKGVIFLVARKLS